MFYCNISIKNDNIEVRITVKNNKAKEKGKVVAVEWVPKQN